MPKKPSRVERLSPSTTWPCSIVFIHIPPLRHLSTFFVCCFVAHEALWRFAIVARFDGSSPYCLMELGVFSTFRDASCLSEQKNRRPRTDMITNTIPARNDFHNRIHVIRALKVQGNLTRDEHCWSRRRYTIIIRCHQLPFSTSSGTSRDSSCDCTIRAGSSDLASVPAACHYVLYTYEPCPG